VVQLPVRRTIRTVMIVGAWQWAQYEDAFAQGLELCGVSVKRFHCAGVFGDGVAGRAQLMVPMPGPSLLSLNLKIVDAVRRERPDAVLFWRPTHVLPVTVKKIRQLGVCAISYNNDDPFGPRVHGNVPWHHHWLWFWYLRCLRHFDFNFFYRRINCEEALDCGALHADVLMPYFVPWVDKPTELSALDRARFDAEAVFAGHYECDGRGEALVELMRANINVRIWSSSEWPAEVKAIYPRRYGKIVPARGADYPKAIAGSQIGLSFLSKLNRDTYTRRCFEIPAIGSLLLCERTDDLLGMFKEDVEACFFSSRHELLDKCLRLLRNPSLRADIAKAGFQRVRRDGHDVTNRARQFLEKIVC
jgi:spore maturation protein CgeB